MNKHYYTEEEKKIELEMKIKFLKKCMSNIKGDFEDCFMPFIEEAKNDDMKLIELLLASEDEKILMSQAYAVASRLDLDGQHWKRVRHMLGEKCKKTISDAGSLKIGNESFSINISNGYGDGETKYAILERNELNDDMMDFLTSVEGTLNIYSYDCGSHINETISGRYGIYRYDGIIVFKKWN